MKMYTHFVLLNSGLSIVKFGLHHRIGRHQMAVAVSYAGSEHAGGLLGIKGQSSWVKPQPLQGGFREFYLAGTDSRSPHQAFKPWEGGTGLKGGGLCLSRFLLAWTTHSTFTHPPITPLGAYLDSVHYQKSKAFILPMALLSLWVLQMCFTECLWHPLRVLGQHFIELLLCIIHTYIGLECKQKELLEPVNRQNAWNVSHWHGWWRDLQTSTNMCAEMVLHMFSGFI